MEGEDTLSKDPKPQQDTEVVEEIANNMEEEREDSVDAPKLDNDDDKVSPDSVKDIVEEEEDVKSDIFEEELRNEDVDEGDSSEDSGKDNNDPPQTLQQELAGCDNADTVEDEELPIEDELFRNEDLKDVMEDTDIDPAPDKPKAENNNEFLLSPFSRSTDEIMVTAQQPTSAAAKFYFVRTPKYVDPSTRTT